MTKRLKIFLAPVVFIIALSVVISFGKPRLDNWFTAFAFILFLLWLIMFIDGLAQDIQDRKKL